MANSVKFFKGASFDSYVEGGIYFEKSTGLIKVGTATGAEAFGGDVKDAVLAGKKLTISFNSGKPAVELDFSDCASASAVKDITDDLTERVEAIEGDYLVEADKTALQGNIDALGTLIGELPEGTDAETVVAYISEVAAKAGVISIADSDAGSYIKVGVDKAQGEVKLEVDETKLSEKFGEVASDIEDITKEGGAIDTAVAAEQTRAEGAESALDTAVKAAQKDVDDLEALVGTPVGGKTIQGEIEDLQDAVSDLEDAKVSVKNAEGDAHIEVTANATNTEYTVAGKDIASAAELSTVSGKVDTLIGDDANKSVRTIANEELAAQLIPESAQESLNTLQEIAAWIQEHPGDAAAMNAAIEALEILHAEGKSVANEVADGINALAGEASSTEGADVVVTVKSSKGEVSEVSVDASVLAAKVTAEETRATGAEEALANRIKALEDDSADADAIAAEKERAEGVEAALDERLADVEDSFVKDVKIGDTTVVADQIASVSFAAAVDGNVNLSMNADKVISAELTWKVFE